MSIGIFFSNYRFFLINNSSVTVYFHKQRPDYKVYILNKKRLSFIEKDCNGDDDKNMPLSLSSAQIEGGH